MRKALSMIEREREREREIERKQECILVYLNVCVCESERTKEIVVDSKICIIWKICIKREQSRE